MAASTSSRPTKVIDIQNGEGIQVGDNNNTNKIFHNCIINITNYYNQPPPPAADTVPARGHTTKPYLRQVQVQVKKKAKNNGQPATAPGRPHQGPASHAVKICTQTVVDSEGSVLEPGDCVEIGSKGNYNYGIFVGETKTHHRPHITPHVLSTSAVICVVFV
ncbi:uncharacterized protein LOC124119114 [Haliotis rufescens]|uniref:uncharacterized protein LOC124119114 n=1 Tax=Haliotis rufescens TaxID=6454 RepID=UPI00201F3C3C|nr:uncharacterized protein LOC124119114 [Haliotis rufescens]